VYPRADSRGRFPQIRLTDHRINLALYSLDRVIEGRL